MRHLNGTVTINSSTWTEIAPEFDIVTLGLFSSQGNFLLQEYTEDGWGSNIPISLNQISTRYISVQKIRLLSISGIIDVNYSLEGFVTFRIKGEESGSGSGDMQKSVYDTDDDGIVDKAESIDDGTNQVTGAQVKIAYDKAHTAGTDQYLDQGGVNQVSAIAAKDAVDKKHIQNSDTKLNEGGANEVTASQLKILKDTTVPAKADKVSTPTVGDFAALDINGNLIDSGHKHGDYAAVDHLHDTDYLRKDNTAEFIPDANYEPATKKYVDDAISGMGGGDMSKATYDTDNDGIVDKSETIDDGAGNSASAADTKDAVTKKHIQNSDTKLDNGGANEVTAAQAKTAYTHSQVLHAPSDAVSLATVKGDADVADAISKKHSQNTDIETSSNDFAVGDNADTDKTITAKNGDATPPKLRYNHTTNKWQFTNDGSTWYDLGSVIGGGGGDMEKSTYDTDNDGIVDKSETIDDGAGNSASAADTKDAVTKKHIQGTDQGLDIGGANEVTVADAKDAVTKKHIQNSDTKLDNGGANEVTAAQAKTAYTHSQLTSGNPHNVNKSDVGLGNVPNLNSTDAVNKAHNQNSDTGTSQNNFDLGDNADTSKTLTIKNGDANSPKIRYNATTSIWEYSDNGVDWFRFGVASGGGVGNGDMLKATYDTDEDGVVDAAESLDDGTNTLTATQILNSVSNQVYNSLLNMYRFLKQSTLTLSGIINGVVDAFVDEIGIDTVNCINQVYNSSDYYRPATQDAGSDEYTKLLLHLDNNVDDSEPTPKTVTNNGVTFSDTIKKFGTHSAYFDGSSDLVVPDSDDFAFGTGDFTIDFWLRFASAPGQVMLVGQYTGNYCMFFFDTSTFFFQASGGMSIEASWSPSLDTWYHVAFVRESGVCNIYVNGVALSKTVNSNPSLDIPNVAGDLYIGGKPSFGFINGYMDEPRISKGIARWTSNFTPPISAYSSESIVFDMTLKSLAQSALAVPEQAWFLLLEEDVDTITINTDLKGYISRDNGTTYTQGTLIYLGSYLTGKKMYGFLLDISAQPSGSDMKYKVTTHNSKNLKIHGIGMRWE